MGVAATAQAQLTLLELRGECFSPACEDGNINSHGGEEASRIDVAPRNRFVARQDTGRVAEFADETIAFSIVATMSGCFC